MPISPSPNRGSFCSKLMGWASVVFVEVDEQKGNAGHEKVVSLRLASANWSQLQVSENAYTRDLLSNV